MAGRAGATKAGTASKTSSEPDLLGIYLNDHLAGLTVEVELARRVVGSHRDSDIGAALERLTAEIVGDRATLRDMMAALAPDCPLDAGALHARASAETGLDDFGAGDYRQRLDVYLTDVRDIDGLTASGTVSFYSQLLQVLKNRLLLTDLLARRHLGSGDVDGLIVANVVPALTRAEGAVYLAGAIVLGLGLVAMCALDIARAGWTRRLFGYSSIYLAGLFALLAFGSFTA